VLLLLLSFFLYFPFRELSFLFFCATTRVSFFYPILLTVVLSLVVVWCPSKSNDTRREQTTHISLLFSSSYEQTEISSYCYNVFTSAEIQTLYKRFQQLDKKHKGYISEDELLNIPELAINPLAPRIVQLFVNVNFKEFCRLLSLLSKNANEKSKISFMFRVYDVDADGIVSRNDLEIILRQLVGSTLSERNRRVGTESDDEYRARNTLVIAIAHRKKTVAVATTTTTRRRTRSYRECFLFGLLER